ncbi:MULTISPECIES: hypothetical protein [Shewanella]|jgi:hypothetical protein|uniref:DUF2726 domain-containing protein n=2 Tax=Shewanella livingstonensis TaxID=150120 RepID=A0A3G8LRS5_9GAMM|nr:MULTISPECIES: hypothetical protein [Shewanella]AZG72127.1 hypothetical protein EGC82_04720 [Shewanella livingstonensis]MBB1361283.1 hypothetical protein [Shewanella sp. SR44-4]MBO1896277.1 hypothetical protein [Shewanella sp. BF02_Schw]PKH33767.1 hypothetical protein CXF88_06710 [Shewanella sp. ALD9]QHS12226.1 hypothetical protein GUY17_03365 [Shewanella sp. Arc9-LZ]
MITSVFLSYAFVYSVLFIVVPFILVIFIMTCIKFFKTDTEEHSIKFKKMLFDTQSFNFLKSLKTMVGGKYDVCCNVPIDTVFEMDAQTAAENHTRFDYVVIDHDSSEVKLVISDFSQQDDANAKSLFEKFNVKLVEIVRGKPYDMQMLKLSLPV